MDLTTMRRTAASHAKVAGVCSGLARGWRIDPLVVRIAAVILTLGGGFGLVLYAAAWLVLPPAGSDRAILDTTFPRWRQWPPVLVIGALIIASLITSAVLSGLLPFGVTPSLVLLAVWYLGFHRPRQRDRSVAREEAATQAGSLAAPASAPFAQETEFTRLAAAWQQRVTDHLATQRIDAPDSVLIEPAPAQKSGVDMHSGPARQQPAYAHHPGYSMEAFLAHPDPLGLYAEAPAGPGETRADSVPHRRTNSRLTWAGVAAAGVAMGVVGLLDHRFEVLKVAYPAAALLVIGLTLVAGTRWGRPRGFLTLGIVLSLMTLGSLAPRSDPSVESGTHIVATADSEIPARVARDHGPVSIDLSQAQLTEDRRMDVSVDLGEVDIRVPENARVRVEYTVDGGGADVLGKKHDGGLDIKDTVDDAGSGTGPLLTIVVHVDLGKVQVHR